MAADEEEAEARTDVGAPALLVGAGRRPRELGAVLSALAAVRNGTGPDGAAPPSPPRGLADLEELLARRPRLGTLVLDVERVPGEDIGFVRRFLERHPAWRMVVLGEDERHPGARALLELPRARWLRWPPDLDEVAGLLQPDAPAARARSASAERAGAVPEGRAPRAEALPELEDDEDDFDGPSPPSAARSASEELPSLPPLPDGASLERVDLAALVEERIAGAALDPSAPRYLFRAEGPVVVARDRAALEGALDGLLGLARQVAGAGGVVGLQVDAAGLPGDPEDTARLRLDFPAGELPGELWPHALERPLPKVSNVPRELAQALREARRAAAALRAAGARVGLRPHKEGRLRIEAFVAATPLDAEEPAAREGEPGAGTPEDPFA